MTRIALLSVYDKTGIVEFARDLAKLDFRVIASAGTFNALQSADEAAARGTPMINAMDVARFTGLGPILGHRVVTLHHGIQGGLLASEEMRPELEERGIPWIDLVCVDLYPLQEAIDANGATLESVTEKTDVGGPTLLRSAAKGNRIVICKPDQRQPVLYALQHKVTSRFLLKLRAEAERCVAEYVAVSANFLREELKRQVAT